MIKAMIVSEHIAISTVRHNHDFYQLIYCKEGIGEITVGENVHKAEPGYVYFVRPMVEHSIKQIDGMHLLEVKFMVEDDQFNNELLKLPEIIPINDDTTLRVSVSDIAKEGISDDLYSHESTNATIQLLLVRLLRKYSTGTDIKRQDYYYLLPRGKSMDFQRMSDICFVQVVDYIEKNLDKIITLDEIAELVHFNKSYLVERFKAVYGVPPMQYVNWMRIERAKVMLVKTDKSITEIAEESGFQSIHYFSRFFKEKEHISPQKYRALHSEKFRENNVAKKDSE